MSLFQVSLSECFKALANSEYLWPINVRTSKNLWKDNRYGNIRMSEYRIALHTQKHTIYHGQLNIHIAIKFAMYINFKLTIYLSTYHCSLKQVFQML